MSRRRKSSRKSSKKSRKGGTSYLPIVVLNAPGPSSSSGRKSVPYEDRVFRHRVREDEGEEIQLDEVEVYDGSLYDFNRSQRRNRERYRSPPRRSYSDNRRYDSGPRRPYDRYRSPQRSRRRRPYSVDKYYENRSDSPQRYYSSSYQRHYTPELTTESQRLPPSNRRSYQPPPNMPGAFLQRRNGPDPPGLGVNRAPFLPPPNQMFASYTRGQGPNPNSINPMFNRPFVPGPQMFGSFDGRAQRAAGGGDSFDLFDGNNVFLLGAIAVCMFFLNRQMNDDFKKRKKRQVSFLDNQYQKANTLVTGLEDFEGKIEKIAGGVDKDENSWLNKLYKQYHGESLAETLEDDNSAEEDEDDIAELNEDEELVKNRAFRKKRSHEELAAESAKKEEEDIQAIFNSVETTCSTKFWRCVSNVVEGGMKYTEMPGGLTGAMKKHLMKVVFAGGINNMWDSLMTVPEARKFQKCMAKQSECKEYEILQKALKSEKAEPQRIIVVPEAIQVEDAEE
ncbi:hypothetical protein TCAL_10178 [Tigriopus californicus]|uniref:Uncharacterized protein n=2 Tax=Tigriopus californicus TaxID=6832 RepID=A0A553PRN2_TIGCA|nr:hypothetical protein TCAL_10178 [Tigriopus californicus]|eukprot:TCALIF_10178-PA protein Name:"Protein of unknown function" AED:0.06 eAED:0.06 QI:50/0.8/0.33/1/0.8/1/6/542/505